MDVGLKALAAALNTSSEDLLKLVKDGEDGYKSDADKILTDKITEHISKMKENLKAQYDESKTNLVNKAVKETSERFEAQLKSKFGLDGEVEDVVQAAFEKLQGSQAAKLDDEKVLSHPKYLELQSKLADERQKIKAEVEGEWSKKYNALQQDIETRELRSVIGQLADDFWSQQQIIDIDDSVKQNWKKEFQERIMRQSKFKKLEDGRVIPVDDEGRALQNDLGHAITTDDILRKSFEGYVPVKQSTDRSSTGGKGGQGGGGSQYTGAMPKTAEEAAKLINDSSLTVEQRSEVLEYAEKNNIL
jgi:hypothetical protein